MLTPDQSKAIEETAKAVQETAKAAQDVVKAARDAGALVNEAMKPISTELLGIATDYAQEVRKRVGATMRAKTAALLENIEPERLSLPSPVVLEPIMEGAQSETREELQDAWAAMLANAFVDRSRKFRPEYSDLLRRLTPTDVVLLNLIAHPDGWETLSREAGFNVIPYNVSDPLIHWFGSAVKAVKLSDLEVQIGRKALEDHGLISPQRGSRPALTALGQGLVGACQVD